ncbi:major royal jelly protein 1 isoform X5 [Diabrotica virgifera virgifera]|uniref:Major royal jelly protein 2-like n=1 Tax=Diabrotica virgifera virgifera TaxID=50390 RepID=A0ABM5KN91_DIAVI|nr:major royal jelly protein 1 isoform X5 [Diabrotica virgifera virgifera]
MSIQRSTGKGMFNVWLEHEAGRGTQEVGSCLQKGLLCLLLTICFSQTFSHGVSSLSDKFKILFQFKQLDFEYPTAAARKSDIDAGLFIPGKPAPIDTDVYYPGGGRAPMVFVTMPRFQDGIPATLGTIEIDKSGNSLIRPYPAWGWQRNPKLCNRLRITSVYRVMVDECHRLWVLDIGQLGDTLGCPPQLLAFDLTTHQLLSKYEIPKDPWNLNSTFVTSVVDIISKQDNCKETYVYMADCIGHSILVYDHRYRKSWIVEDETMKPDPKFEKYTIDGTSFETQDGVLGMALSPFIPGEGRRLYYHSMSSDTEHYVKTSDLKNRYLWELRKPFPTLFKTYAGTRKTQSAAEAIDRNGVQFFGLMKDIEVACFVTRGEYGIPGNYSDIVASNQKTLQFVSGIKAIKNPAGGEDIYMVTSRFQRVATGTLNSAEINFRIQKASTYELTAHTKCDPRYSPPIPPRTTGAPNVSPGPVIFPQDR